MLEGLVEVRRQDTVEVEGAIELGCAGVGHELPGGAADTEAVESALHVVRHCGLLRHHDTHGIVHLGLDELPVSARRCRSPLLDEVFLAIAHGGGFGWRGHGTGCRRRRGRLDWGSRGRGCGLCAGRRRRCHGGRCRRRRRWRCRGFRSGRRRWCHGGCHHGRSRGRGRGLCAGRCRRCDGGCLRGCRRGRRRGQCGGRHCGRCCWRTRWSCSGGNRGRRCRI
mmetsp:Transcript_18955/g.64278  ORF Transcript_18955/g.64278 Transcript_18955/m.64278 type:complete len:223 (-) Transcript_18955:38-706(-)